MLQQILMFDAQALSLCCCAQPLQFCTFFHAEESPASLPKKKVFSAWSYARYKPSCGNRCPMNTLVALHHKGSVQRVEPWQSILQGIMQKRRAQDSKASTTITRNPCAITGLSAVNQSSQPTGQQFLLAPCQLTVAAALRQQLLAQQQQSS